MSTERIWRLANFRGRSQPDNDVATFALLSEGTTYAVTIAGPKGMTVRQLTDALRAALWYGGRAGGTDLSVDLRVRLPAPGELTAPGKLS